MKIVDFDPREAARIEVKPTPKGRPSASQPEPAGRGQPETASCSAPETLAARAGRVHLSEPEAAGWGPGSARAPLARAHGLLGPPG